MWLSRLCLSSICSALDPYSALKKETSERGEGERERGREGVSQVGSSLCKKSKEKREGFHGRTQVIHCVFLSCDVCSRS